MILFHSPTPTCLSAPFCLVSLSLVSYLTLPPLGRSLLCSRLPVATEKIRLPRLRPPCAQSALYCLPPLLCAESYISSGFVQRLNYAVFVETVALVAGLNVAGENSGPSLSARISGLASRSQNSCHVRAADFGLLSETFLNSDSLNVISAPPFSGRAARG